MLRRLLCMMFVLGGFNSLIPSSAAADVKEAHHLQATRAAEQPLYLPDGIFDQYGSLPLGTLGTIIWFRDHPSFVDALISPKLPYPIVSSIAIKERPIILNTLLDLHAHIDDDQLINFIGYITGEQDSAIRRDIQNASTIARHALPTLIKIIDRLLEQGSSKSSLQDLLHKTQSSYATSTHVKPGMKYLRSLLFENALEYLTLLEQAAKERAQTIREALDPALLRELTDIAVQYDVPVPARPTTNPQSPKAPKGSQVELSTHPHK